MHHARYMHVLFLTITLTMTMTGLRSVPHPDGLSYKVALLGADKPAVVATDAKPRAEISLLDLCRGAKEGNFKLTDAPSESASTSSFSWRTKFAKKLRFPKIFKYQPHLIAGEVA